MHGSLYISDRAVLPAGERFFILLIPFDGLQFNYFFVYPFYQIEYLSSQPGHGRLRMPVLAAGSE